MRPGANKQAACHPERKVNGMPTPLEHRFCQDGQLTALWDVNNGSIQLTAPDMLVGFQAQFITLSGVYTMEMNRFDAFTHYRNWTETPPNAGQRKLLRKYLGFVLYQWQDAEPRPLVQTPMPTMPGTQTQNPIDLTSTQEPLTPVPQRAGPPPPIPSRIPIIQQLLETHRPQPHTQVSGPSALSARRQEGLVMGSPFSLHPNSVWAAPAPASHHQAPAAQGRAVHMNLPAQLPATAPRKAQPLIPAPEIQTIYIPREGQPIMISPQVESPPKGPAIPKRPDSPSVPRPSSGKAPKPVCIPTSLPTIEEQPIKLRIKRRLMDKSAPATLSWEVEDIPPKTHQQVCPTPKSPPPPPPSSPEDSNLVIDMNANPVTAPKN